MIHPPTHTKLPRKVSAWCFDGTAVLPSNIRACVWAHPDGYRFCIINPNSLTIAPLRPGDWIIQTEHGCVYAVPPHHFAAKYQ
jgi:hypothetical protein